MNVDLRKPVIWTSIGNVNEDELVRTESWEIHGASIVHISTYTYHGDVVKRAVHGRILSGAEASVISKAIQEVIEHG